MDLKPCFLCILQRIACIIIAIGALFNIVKPYTSKIKNTGLIIIVIGLISGICAAIRHIYIQAHPIETFACGPSVDFIVKNNSIIDALPKLFKATGECQTIDWTFMGMTMPMVSLLVFLLIFSMLLISKYLSRK
jgi:disulfide bond formation protein DsbB